MKRFQHLDNEQPGREAHLQASLLLAACQEALLFNQLLKDNPREVAREKQEVMLFHYSRFSHFLIERVVTSPQSST